MRFSQDLFSSSRNNGKIPEATPPRHPQGVPGGTASGLFKERPPFHRKLFTEVAPFPKNEKQEIIEI
jgi:hypothetical protein